MIQNSHKNIYLKDYFIISNFIVKIMIFFIHYIQCQRIIVGAVIKVIYVYQKMLKILILCLMFIKPIAKLISLMNSTKFF